jgi:hypothetical protein
MNARSRFFNQGQQPPPLHFFESQPGAGGRQEHSFILAENSQFGRAGQLVQLALSPADVHDPTELSTYLAGYKVEGLLADEVSPAILTDMSTDKYRTFTEDNAFLAVDVKTGIEAKVPEIDPESRLAQYTVIERAIGSFVPDRVASQASYDVRKAAMKRCSRALMLDREIDVMSLLTTAGNWNAGNVVTLGASAAWNGGASSDPYKDLQDRCEASLQRVTKILMARHVSNAFTRHTEVREHLKQFIGDTGARDLLDPQDSETYKLPGLPVICVSDAKHTITKGVAPSWTWGNDVVLVTEPGGTPSDGEEIRTSETWRLKGPSGNGFVTREFRVDDRGALGGIFIVAALAEVAKMPGPNCGGLIKAAYQ